MLFHLFFFGVGTLSQVSSTSNWCENYLQKNQLATFSARGRKDSKVIFSVSFLFYFILFIIIYLFLVGGRGYFLLILLQLML